ncbi:MAG TPA: hypothetical protein VJ851_17995 [Jatrophihabitans sp.]|nr:hypothetical protein [Jatrophihabitans sp.]
MTKAQKHAAEMIVERSARSGRTVRSGVSKIADATSVVHSRSAATGRFVARNPASTTKSTQPSSLKK